MRIVNMKQRKVFLLITVLIIGVVISGCSKNKKNDGNEQISNNKISSENGATPEKELVDYAKDPELVLPDDLKDKAEHSEYSGRVIKDVKVPADKETEYAIANTKKDDEYCLYNPDDFYESNFGIIQYLEECDYDVAKAGDFAIEFAKNIAKASEGDMNSLMSTVSGGDKLTLGDKKQSENTESKIKEKIVDDLSKGDKLKYKEVIIDQILLNKDRNAANVSCVFVFENSKGETVLRHFRHGAEYKGSAAPLALMKGENGKWTWTPANINYINDK